MKKSYMKIRNKNDSSITCMPPEGVRSSSFVSQLLPFLWACPSSSPCNTWFLDLQTDNRSDIRSWTHSEKLYGLLWHPKSTDPNAFSRCFCPSTRGALWFWSYAGLYTACICIGKSIIFRKNVLLSFANCWRARYRPYRSRLCYCMFLQHFSSFTWFAHSCTTLETKKSKTSIRH